MTSLIQKLNQIGQSIWYDNIERKLLKDGTLEGMYNRGEIRGITSNPSIFNKAISQSDEYDDEIRSLTKENLSRDNIYERLAISDIQTAADLFRPLYDQTNGDDGYVSLEVSPYLAHDANQTISEANMLWNEVNRPNLMVKIPATKAGLPAITETIAAGINVNVTLIFSLDRYREVREAYLAGLEKRASAGKTVANIASVASFFISRIDTKVDKQLESLIKTATPEEKQRIEGLMGKAAVASGKLAFQDYEDTFGDKGTLFGKLKPLGAKRQRVLWASTSTKNPAYPDTKYVEEMIGPLTINTVPPNTLEAFLDHGVVERTIDQNLEAAHNVMTGLSGVGIDLDQATQELEAEGVKSFADAYTSLLDSLQSRMHDFQK
ncbi:MAG: transaldolase [Anaerolineales bacterium]|nr:transaldolase [Anaerolineales bacterium]